MIHFIRMVCEKPEKSKKVSLRLGEILVLAGVISTEELKIALERQAGTGKLLGTLLIEDGLATGEEIAFALGRQLGIPETVGTGGMVGR